MSLVEVKSITPNRVVNVGNKTFHFGKDSLCMIEEEFIEDLIKNPNYSLTGNKEVKKVIKGKEEIKKVIKVENTVEKVKKGNKKPTVKKTK